MSGQCKANVGVNTAANNKVSRETSPIPIERYENQRKYLKNGQFAVIHNMPNYEQVGQPQQTHRMRNAMLLLGLGAGIGAMYRYRQPLMKLGQKAYNYASDKFHNLFANPSNETAVANPHNW